MTGHERTPMGDLVAALGSLTDPPKDGRVEAGQRRYRYLELTDLLAEVRSKFAAHGWAIMQQVTVADGAVTVVNLWLHESGEQLAHLPFTLPSGRSPQDIGSSTSYARRYSLAALVGLAGSDDDDAQIAQARRVEPLSRPVERTQAKADQPDPWQTPPPRPVAATEWPDASSPSLSNKASDKSIKMMWALQKKSGMTPDQFRPWVATLLTIDGDWHTADLTQAQVSAVIRRLQEDAAPVEEPPE